MIHIVFQIVIRLNTLTVDLGHCENYVQYMRMILFNSLLLKCLCILLYETAIIKLYPVYKYIGFIYMVNLGYMTFTYHYTEYYIRMADLG